MAADEGCEEADPPPSDAVVRDAAGVGAGVSVGGADCDPAAALDSSSLVFPLVFLRLEAEPGLDVVVAAAAAAAAARVGAGPPSVLAAAASSAIGDVTSTPFIEEMHVQLLGLAFTSVDVGKQRPTCVWPRNKGRTRRESEAKVVGRKEKRREGAEDI